MHLSGKERVRAREWVSVCMCGFFWLVLIIKVLVYNQHTKRSWHRQYRTATWTSTAREIPITDSYCCYLSRHGYSMQYTSTDGNSSGFTYSARLKKWAVQQNWEHTNKNKRTDKTLQRFVIVSNFHTNCMLLSSLITPFFFHFIIWNANEPNNTKRFENNYIVMSETSNPIK